VIKNQRFYQVLKENNERKKEKILTKRLEKEVSLPVFEFVFLFPLISKHLPEKRSSFLIFLFQN